MHTKLSIAAGILMMAAALAPSGATATPAMPQTRIVGVAADAGSLVQKAQFGRCRFWHRECADRWGWRTRGFYRCLWRHGC
jgi:hypothetical protein